MAITAASIETNGWVLRLTVTGVPGSFASYALDPDGSAKVTLTCSHPGFAPVGGVVIATPLTRVLVATKPLRLPVNLVAPTTFVIDETDHGDGTVTVRLALSDYVHATETSLALAVAAGWRAGEPAAAGPAVTNNSTFVAALPIFRWADVPYQRSADSFTLELTAHSHHPQGLAAVAGVKFTVTDGTTVKTVWATALGTSTRYDDQVRVYAATFDPAAAPALTAGLLRCDAEVYPWLGAMRSTDPAATRSMTGLDLAGYRTVATTPFVIGYDPAGTRYGAQILFVDPVGGTATAAATMVKPDLASAKALAPALRPKDISTALQALYLANRSLAAANGQAARSRAADSARIVLAAGTHFGVGTTAVTSGLTTAELPAIVEGDPDDPAPRANCVLRTGTATGVRITKCALRNLTLEVGLTSLTATSTGMFQLDNCELRGKAGSETSNTPPFASTPAAGNWLLSATRTRWWKTGSTFSGVNARFALVRNCEWSRRADALCLLGGRFIPATEDSWAVGPQLPTGSWNSATDIGALEDVIIAGCELRSALGRVWSAGGVAAAVAGTPNQSYRRLVFANNLCERFGTDPQPFWSIGEDANATMSYLIVEGNSFVGERCNVFYSDPFPTTIAEANSQLNQAYGNRVANNSFDWAATKHDAFDDATTKAVRGSANGCRPQMVETWSVTYGVGFEGNYDFGRHPSAGSFRFEYFGRRGVQDVGGAPAWPADRSTYGSPATGGGSYRPPAGSTLLGRGRRASTDHDRAGVVRAIPFAAGAVDAQSMATVALVPAASVLASRASAGQLGWSGMLTPTRGAHAVGGTDGRIEIDPGSYLRPESSNLAVRYLDPTLLQPRRVAAAERILFVTGDFRSLDVPSR